MSGDFPRYRKAIRIQSTISPIDVIEEYTRPARLLEHRSIVTKQAMSEVELMHFNDIGTLEAFNTDGLRSLLFTMSLS